MNAYRSRCSRERRAAASKSANKSGGIPSSAAERFDMPQLYPKDSLYNSPHLFNPLLRFLQRRRFGDDSHDRLGVARPGVDPGAVPVDAQAVLGVDFFAGEFFLQGFHGAIRILPLALKLRFHDLVARNLGHQLADRLVS